MFYKLFFRRILFFLNPEFSHNFVFKLLKILFLIPGFRYLLRFSYCVTDDRLKRKLFGLRFKNPIGLAAGFDKNAQMFNELTEFGFGFIEIGTVTPLPQEGNPKPRLFRLKKDRALINRMGFNNDGIEVIVKRLKNKYNDIIIGGNIGKNKMTPNEEASRDYIKCFEKIAPYVDYLVLNISSPNTPGLVKLQNKSYLTQLLSEIQNLNFKKYNKPILIKISPDLTLEQLDEILELIYKFKISGVIATNTTSKREGLKTVNKIVTDYGPGGLSGAPLKLKSTQIISYINKKTSGLLPIIAVGGIMDEDDVIQMLDAGASLVQIYTAFVYQGPSIIKKMNQKILSS